MNVIIKSAMFWLFCTCFHLFFLFQPYSEMTFTFNRFTAINNVISLFMNVGLHNENINYTWYFLSIFVIILFKR